MHAKHTKTPWDLACDSYSKVQHSRKACVYANTKGNNGDRIVTIAGRIENWDDAAFIVRACNAHEALVAALQGIIEVGKRDLSNPKYDGYFEAAKQALKLIEDEI